MKKKTSLWISGITTVAMLAVAVGSFAAWDTLTDKTMNFTATSSEPAALSAEADSSYNNTTKLIPEENAANPVNNTTGAADDIVVGKVNAYLTGADSTTKVNWNGKVSIGDAENADDFTVSLQPLDADGNDSGSVLANNAEVTGISSNSTTPTKYAVHLKFAKDSKEIDGTTLGNLDDIKVDVTFTATKTK
ncbi:hypothetical protein [Eubacterium maltosivorans]|uniref:Uncharacterized protein n=1 Tax=Eubacterium maltosivorans TaxID=2041044 RepID=A0A4P9CA71_EUBML|nr:hypothetical protein [Eubacterium maltosivorans]QCT72459.1 hypothetical protein CPZ25_014330 [Eubacterium maltosivorans]